jgi:hypothetical protein
VTLPAGPRQAVNEPGGNWITCRQRDDWDVGRSLFSGKCRRKTHGHNYIDAARHQFIHEPWKALNLPLGGPAFEYNIATNRIAAPREAADKRGAKPTSIGTELNSSGGEHPNAIDLG